MKYLFTILTLSLSTLLSAQNLVPNPSFEGYNFCPTNTGEMTACLDWVSPGSTPDYCHECNSGPVNVPNNQWGFQEGKTGRGYAHVISYYPTQATNYREYIQVQLSSPLMADSAYEVGFYVSCAEGRYAINAIGAHLSVTAPVQNGSILFPSTITPQVSNTSGSMLMDTAGWTHISGIFTATGGEEYLTIGTFQDDNTIQIQEIGVQGNTGSYYIENVNVIPVGGNGSTSALFENEFDQTLSIYPNPTNGIINIELDKSYSTIKINVLDIYGKLIHTNSFSDSETISLNIDGDSGYYFMEIVTSDGKTAFRKVLKK